MGETETHSVEVRLVRESDKAYLLEHKEHGESWFPKSQIHFENMNHKSNVGCACIPTWLMEAKKW